jgi:uncharacterized protein (TIGR02271 family)
LNRSKAKASEIIVVDMNGVRGTLVQEDALPVNSERSGEISSESHWLARFQNGKQVLIPKELLTRRKDGSYQLAMSIEDLVDSEELPLVIPVTEERATVEKRVRETGRVEIRKSVHERVEVVDQPLHSDEVEIERVAINRVIEEPVAVRYEGDTTIIPLLEEVLVVEKRLVLREEVRIRKVRKEVHDPQEVLLREEQVDIVRKPAS